MDNILENMNEEKNLNIKSLDIELDYIPSEFREDPEKLIENSTEQIQESDKKYIPPLTYSMHKYYNPKNMLLLKKLIFPPINKDKLNQIMIDNESIKYITFNSSAQEITNIIMNNLFDFPCPIVGEEQKWKNKSLDKKMKQLVITEMTAGVGGNVLNFSKYFKYVNAIEIDNIRYNYLCKNVKLYGCDNVNCYNDDSLNLLIHEDNLVQDLIFFDPPWGGKDYKLFKNLRLNFGTFSIEKVCELLFQRKRNKMIILKLPNNYDMDFFQEELKEYRISKFILDRMTIMVVKNYQYMAD